MGGILKITEVGGKSWELVLLPNTVYSIGRAKDNDIVLNDQRVSRRHAQIKSGEDEWTLIDGYYVDGELKRSVNRVFVNGLPQFEKILESSDVITIGGSRLEFERAMNDEPTEKLPDAVNYDDQPLGHTQLLISASEIIGKRSNLSIETNLVSPEEIKDLRRKAQVLELLYEMSKTLGTVFDLKEIFVKATDLIFRGTPAERVVALIA
ncbi:MAG TPA: FHA domain-containing protein, partial [Pyrinomonadaceae bacterium]